MYISILIIKKYRYKCSAVLYVYLYINYQELSSFMLLVATQLYNLNNDNKYKIITLGTPECSGIIKCHLS